jgi:hypothetical protein
MFGGAIAWSSKRQATVSTSTVQAELQACGSAAREALWLGKLFLYDLRLKLPGDVMHIFGDNQGALAVVRNPVESPRTKHIDVIYHFVRERVEMGELLFTYIPTKDG